MSDGSEYNDGKGPEHKIREAQVHALERYPDLAHNTVILSVGYQAWREDRDVADVLEEVANG